MSYKGGSFAPRVVIIECVVSMNANTHNIIKQHISLVMKNIYTQQEQLRKAAMLLDKMDISYDVSRTNETFRDMDKAVEWFASLEVPTA